MRRRILVSILAVVIMTALLLGLPLMYTAWLWVEDFTRNDLQARLDRMAAEIISQEGSAGLIEGQLDIGLLRLAIPQGGRLVVIYPTPEDAASRADIGQASVPGHSSNRCRWGPRDHCDSKYRPTTCVHCSGRLSAR